MIFKLDWEGIQLVSDKMRVQNAVRENRMLSTKVPTTRKGQKQRLDFEPKGKRNIEHHKKRWRDQLHVEG